MFTGNGKKKARNELKRKFPASNQSIPGMYSNPSLRSEGGLFNQALSSPRTKRSKVEEKIESLSDKQLTASKVSKKKVGKPELKSTQRAPSLLNANLHLSTGALNSKFFSSSLVLRSESKETNTNKLSTPKTSFLERSDLKSSGLLSNSSLLSGSNVSTQTLRGSTLTRSSLKSNLLSSSLLSRETEDEDVKTGAEHVFDDYYADCNSLQVDYDLPPVSDGIEDYVPPPLQDVDLPSQTNEIDPNLKLKKQLVNEVSGSLLKSPDFSKPDDPARVSLQNVCQKVVKIDPEFILKVAIYCRRELNIRTTANFLLALAASDIAVRPSLKKYFKETIRLPSDWIDVADISASMNDDEKKSVPSALRKVLSEKFADFDVYQLSKYNKTKKKTGYTVKQLIRQLHISKPAEHVMSIIGSKYPDTLEKFHKSQLPGTFDESRAGERMKLPIAETWETQVSARGNKHDVWESLIDNKKLPFMAMLRNLRNMIQAGISEKYNRWCIKKLSDADSIANSKQFPFRFFTAFKALSDLEKDLKGGDGRPMRRGQQTQSGASSGGYSEALRKKQQAKKDKPKLYDQETIDRYRTALEKSIQLSANYNVSPIPNTTVILCWLGPEIMGKRASKGGPRCLTTVGDISILFSLMCYQACENGTLVFYGPSWSKVVTDNKTTNILEQTEMYSKMAERSYSEANSVEHSINEKIKNIILNTKNLHTVISLGDDDIDDSCLDDVITCTRRTVNKDLLYVSLDLTSSDVQVETPDEDRHPNDVKISGFSDHILRYIAERGDEAQIQHIDNIDLQFDLVAEAERTVIADQPKRESDFAVIPPPKPIKWHTVRIFISSTFLDMHGERDILSRYVFPELRTHARKHLCNVVDVDLRWGIPADHTQSKSFVRLCLDEVEKCDYFISLIGDRYGTIVDSEQTPTTLYKALNRYTGDNKSSITGLEVISSLSKDDRKCFHYLRDEGVNSEIPNAYMSQFTDENRNPLKRITRQICSKTHRFILDGYTARFGGVVDNKPICIGLESFASSVLEQLRTAISRDYSNDDEDETTTDWYTNMQQEQATVMTKYANSYVGGVASEMIGVKVSEPLPPTGLGKRERKDTGLVVVTGEQGAGKSTAMAHYIQTQQNSIADSDVKLYYYMIQPNTTVDTLLLYLNRTLRDDATSSYSNKKLPINTVNLEQITSDKHVELFQSTLETYSKIIQIHELKTTRIILDGTDNLIMKTNSFDWIPASIPKNIQFVISVTQNTPRYRSLVSHTDAREYKLESLSFNIRRKIITEKLAESGKQLDENAFDNQMSLIVQKRNSDNPGYLHLICEEIRIHGVFETVSKTLKSMPQTMPTLVEYVLKQCEAELGVQLVQNFCKLLISMPNGGTQNDLVNLMNIFHQLPIKYKFTDVKTVIDSNRRVIPTLLTTQLIYRLHQLLKKHHQTGVIEFAFKAVEDVVKQRYMRNSEQEVLTQLLISCYYKERLTYRIYSHYRDVIYHLKLGRQFSLVKELLTDLEFLVVKVNLGLISSLTLDFSEELSGKQKTNSVWSNIYSTLIPYKEFIYKNIQQLVEYPHDILQLAYNEPSLHQSASSILDEKDIPYFDWLTKPNASDNVVSSMKFSNKITSLDFSADGRLLALGGSDMVLRIFDTNTLQELLSLRGHSHIIQTVKFINKNRLVSCSSDGSAAMWNIDKGKRSAVMKKHNGVVSSLAFSSDSEIFSVGWDGKLVHWNKHGKFSSNVGQIPTAINDIAIYEHTVAVACWDKTIKVFNYATNKRVAVLRGHSTSVRSVKYSPTGRHLTSASLDGEIKLWSADRGQPSLGEFKAHSEPVKSLCYTSAGDHLVTVGEDSKLRVWSSDPGYLESSTQTGLTQISCIHVEYVDGVYIVMLGTFDGLVCVKQFENGKPIKDMRISLSQDEKIVCVYTVEIKLCRYYFVLTSNCTYHKLVESRGVLTRKSSKSCDLSIKSAEIFLLRFGSDVEPQLFAVFVTTNGTMIYLKDLLKESSPVEPVPFANEYPVTCMAIKYYKSNETDRTSTIAAGLSSGQVNIFLGHQYTDKRGIKIIADFNDQPDFYIKRGFPDPVISISWLSDQTLACCSNDIIKAYYVASSKLTAKVQCEMSSADGLISQLSSVGTGIMAALSSSTNVVRFWTSTGNNFSSVKMPSDVKHITTCDLRLSEFNEDKDLVADEGTDSDDSYSDIEGQNWADVDEIENLKEQQKTKHEKKEEKTLENLKDMELSASKTKLITVLQDGTIQWWSAARRGCYQENTGPSGALSVACYSDRVACTFEDGSMSLYKISDLSSYIDNDVKSPITALHSLTLNNGRQICVFADESGYVHFYELSDDSLVFLKSTLITNKRGAICGISLYEDRSKGERKLITAVRDRVYLYELDDKFNITSGATHSVTHEITSSSNKMVCIWSMITLTRKGIAKPSQVIYYNDQNKPKLYHETLCVDQEGSREGGEESVAHMVILPTGNSNHTTVQRNEAQPTQQPDPQLLINPITVCAIEAENTDSRCRYYGFEDGTVEIEDFQHKRWIKKRVHSGRITGIFQTGYYHIITSSLDGFIKVFNLQLKLVSQFNLGSPVTSLHIQDEYRDTVIYAGDRRGQLHVLRYHSTPIQDIAT